MSFAVSDLSRIPMSKVPEKLQIYRELILAAEPVFKLDGKGLETACAEHAQNLMFYDLMLQEAKAIENWARMKMGEVEGRLYKSLNEGRQQRLSSTDIKAYIAGEPDYVQAYEIVLEVAHIKNQLQSIVEALQAMGYSLNNIVKIRVAQLEHVTL